MLISAIILVCAMWLMAFAMILSPRNVADECVTIKLQAAFWANILLIAAEVFSKWF